MKRWLAVAALGLAFVLAATDLRAEETKVTITGDVSAIYDEAFEKIEGARVSVWTTDEEGNETRTVYNVTMDEKGKKLAEELDGEEAQVSGTLAKKGDPAKPELWLTVKSYTRVAAEDEAEE
ncbi:MAG: hypothetical protein ACOCX4_03245 [Planctomycetota bacterium]